MSQQKHYLVCLLTSACLLSGQFTANAETVLDKNSDPLNVTFKSQLSAQHTQQGEAFTAVLNGDHHYNDQTLPDDTLLYGTVDNVQESRPGLRPGFLAFDVEKAVFPNGLAYDFEVERAADEIKKLHARKVYHKEGNTPARAVKSAIPFSLVSMADAIPLKYAAGLSTWQIVPISLAARMTYGAIAEMKSRKHEHWPTQGRVGYGMLRGTGIPGMVGMIRPSKGAEFNPGDTGELHLNPEWVSGLFTAGENINVLMKADESNNSETEEKNIPEPVTLLNQIRPE